MIATAASQRVCPRYRASTFATGGKSVKAKAIGGKPSKGLTVSRGLRVQASAGDQGDKRNQELTRHRRCTPLVRASFET
eukprot:7117491-Pyramimonas_sp.AAC.1